MDDTRVTNDPSPREVEAALSSVEQALGTLISARLDRVDDDEIPDLAVAVEKVARLAAVAQCKLAGEVHQRELDTFHGYTSTSSYLRDLLHVTGSTGARRVKNAATLLSRTNLLGEALPAKYPHLAAPVIAGTASLEHAAVAVRRLGKLPDSVSLDDREQAERHLADLSRQWDPGALHAAAIRLGQVMDPDGVLADENEQQAKQEFTLVRHLHGMWRASGSFDTESANVLTAALDPLCKPAKQSDGSRDPRPAAQRRAEALVDSVRMGMDHTQRSKSGGQRPHLLVTTTLAELRSQAGIGEWSNGEVASIEPVLEQACNADATLAVLADNGRLLYYGRGKRFAPHDLRKALVARDGGCTFDGCDAPPEHCDVHHVVHWAAGGGTSIHTTTFRCKPHHRLEHRSGWRTEMIDGVPHAVPPPWIDPAQTPRRNRIRHRRPP